MQPTVIQFHDDTELMAEVRRQAANGVSKNDLYVVSHDDDRTDRVAGTVNANEPDELSNSVGTVYNQKGDELREIFEEFGFDQTEANNLEEKLDHGNIMLIIDTN